MHTSLTLTPLIAGMVMRGGGTIFGFSPMVLISLAFGACILVGICWQILDNWVERTRGRNWPTASAIIDVVSVAFIGDNIPSPKANLDHPYHLATLTYSYSNPEQQMGDYSRRFATRTRLRPGRIPTKALLSQSTLTRATPHVPYCEKKTCRKRQSDAKGKCGGLSTAATCAAFGRDDARWGGSGKGQSKSGFRCTPDA
jgi:hypothetical protein